MASVVERLANGLDTVLDKSVLGGYPKWGLAVRRRLPGWPADPRAGALTGQAAFVTGASSGLGVATAVELARLGAAVHLVVRDEAKGARVAADIPGDVRVWRCDVSDLDDVTRFAKEVEEADTSVDVLVHNAGVLPAERRTTPQGHEVTLATHVLGPLRMTDLLRPARAIFVSSGGMYAQRLPVDDPEYAQGEYRGAAAYARTKRIQVALVPLLSQRWPGVAVYATHPGWADTPGVVDSLPMFHRITGPVLRDAAGGADTTVWLAAADPAPRSGRFYHDRRARDPHLVPWTRHDEAARNAMFEWCVAAALT